MSVFDEEEREFEKASRRISEGIGVNIGDETPFPYSIEDGQDRGSESDLAEILEGYLFGEVEQDDETRHYFETMAQAMILFAERGKAYGSSWNRHGALGNLLKLDIKNTRLMNAYWFADEGAAPPEHKDAADDALDAINYAAFFYTCQERGNMRGRNR